MSLKLRAASISFGLVLALVGLLVGLLGLALCALWTMTDHVVAYRNQNLFLLSPLAMALPWYGVRIVRRGFEAIHEVRPIAILLAGSAAVALALKVTPVAYQDNGALVAFFLPCWAGLLLASLLAVRAAANRGAASPIPPDPRGIRTELATPETER